MRRIGLEVLAVAVFGLCAGGARAADPCSPAQSFGGPLASLIGQFTQQQRAQACVTERQAQWAEYNGRQKAAADKAAADKIAADKVVADAALQKQAADAKIVGRVAAPARRGRAVRDTVVAEIRVRHRREASRVDAPDPQVAEAHRHEVYLRLVRDENAPDNLCHDPKTARTVMTGWNGLDTMKGASVQVIDIEHMTTVYVHADDKKRVVPWGVRDEPWRAPGGNGDDAP